MCYYLLGNPLLFSKFPNIYIWEVDTLWETSPCQWRIYTFFFFPFFFLSLFCRFRVFFQTQFHSCEVYLTLLSAVSFDISPTELQAASPLCSYKCHFSRSGATSSHWLANWLDSVQSNFLHMVTQFFHFNVKYLQSLTVPCILHLLVNW